MQEIRCSVCQQVSHPEIGCRSSVVPKTSDAGHDRAETFKRLQYTVSEKKRDQGDIQQLTTVLLLMSTRLHQSSLL